jgi:hypothetical protein
MCVCVYYTCYIQVYITCAVFTAMLSMQGVSAVGTDAVDETVVALDVAAVALDATAVAVALDALDVIWICSA